MLGLTCVNAHDQLYEGGEGQQGEDGGKRHVVREVDHAALGSLEANLRTD